MRSYGLDIDRLSATPREVIRKALGEHPPLPSEPIILDSEEGNSGKDTKSTDEKSTE